jgi:virulence factor Mce-like protein
VIRRPGSSVVANPVLVGAVTFLVTAVAVFLSYNANNGLPFVPTTRLHLRMANGSNLIKGSDVREGGFRVGVVDELRPVELGGGRVGAEAVLRLDRSVGRVPVDSRFDLRARGAIGSKYIDIVRGRSGRAFADGAVVPADRTRAGVDLDEVLSTFDARTRQGVRGTLLGLGNALAGRGADVNTTVSRLPRMLALTAPVMGNLAAPGTDLDGFIRSAARTTRALAPVAGPQARLFTTMADTFAALSRDGGRALQDTITEVPRTLASGTRSLRSSRPFLRHAAALARSLEPTTVALRRGLPDINAGLAPVPRAFDETAPLAGRARATLSALDRLARDPATNTALRALTATSATLLPQARFYGPAFTVCRIPQAWLQFVPDVLDSPDPTGFAQRGIVATTDDTQHDDLSTMGANEFATGRGPVTGSPQHLHADVYGYFVDQRGNADCLMAGGGYRWGWNPFDTTPDRYYRRAVVEHFPAGRLGSIWTRFGADGRPSGARGPDRVPPGQTFTRDPGGRAAPKAP